MVDVAISDSFRGSSPEGYQIRRELGHGASAIVYLAQDLKHDRRVAIKALHRDLEVAPSRFLSEIRIVANLQHPHILPLHNSGVWDDRPFFVMPYVDGETLADRLDRERQLPVEDAVRIAAEVADALAYAHRHGVVHRDIKPANILLSSGHALVADFGIARAIHRAAAERLSHTGLAVGTPAYMSPEQASGDVDVDGRSDIYSLGCVLYEMLAGVRPFIGPNGDAVAARRLLEEPPSVRQLRPSVPPQLERVIQRAMSLTRADRFQTGEEFARALAAASGIAIDSPAFRARSPARVWKTAAAAAITLSVVAWAVARQTARATPPLDESAYATFPFRHGAGADAMWLDGDGCARLLHDAISRWQGVRAVNDMVANDVWVRRQPRTVEQVITAAEALGARWVTWGEVLGVGDSIEIRASVYDVARGPRTARQFAVRLSRSSPNVDSAFAVLADSILIGGRLSAEARATAAAGGTKNVDALRSYLDGREALSRFDLSGALDHFRRAVERDAAFGLAQLWLARTTAWLGDAEPSAWRDAASNASLAGRLTPADREHAFALLDLAEGRMQEACERYRRAIARDSLDFAAWYGLGECHARDSIVVRDPRSPSGWAFRSSFHTAIHGYRRALTLAPSFHLAERGAAFTRLSRRVFFIEEVRLRRGVALTAGKPRFAAFPSFLEDTLAFVPYPYADVIQRSELRPRTERQAVQWSAATYRDLMDDWVRAFPASANALESDALAIEATSGSAAEIAPALQMARRAVARADSPDQKVRAQATVVRLLLKMDSVAAARAVVDSVLRTWRSPNAYQAGYLAGLATVTGRARAAAALLSKAPANTEHIPFFGADGRQASLPFDILSDASQLLVYASLGVPTDSIRSTFARADRRIVTRVRAAERQASREMLFRLPIGLAYSELAPIVTFDVDPWRDLVLQMRRALASRDTAGARRASRELSDVTSDYVPGTVTFDRLFHQASVLLALGDSAEATAVLDHALGALPHARNILLKTIPQAASLPRAMILRAQLAWQRRDTATFERWARPAVTLWSDADRELRRPIDELQSQLNSLR